jgi:hypothetical protein
MPSSKVVKEEEGKGSEALQGWVTGRSHLNKVHKQARAPSNPDFPLSSHHQHSHALTRFQHPSYSSSIPSLLAFYHQPYTSFISSFFLDHYPDTSCSVLPFPHLFSTISQVISFSSPHDVSSLTIVPFILQHLCSLRSDAPLCYCLLLTLP